MTEKKTLRELGRIVGGLPAPSVTAETGEVPFVRMRELGRSHHSNNFLPSDEYLLPQDAQRYGSRALPIGAILFPRSGSVHLNHRAILRHKAVIVSHIAGLLPVPSVDPEYLYYLLCTFDMTELMTQTTGLNSIQFSKLYEKSFDVIPERQQQAKIAQVLATLDRAIAQTDALLAKQQRVKVGLMQELLTRGIDADGNRRDPRTHAFKDSPLGPIPVEWRYSTLADVGKWVSGGTPNKDTEAFWAGPIPWASPKDMKLIRLQDTIDHISEAGLRAGTRLLPPKSIIVVVRGMILAKEFPVCLTMCSMAINQDVKGIIPGNNFNTEFLMHWLVNAKSKILQIATESTHGTKRIDMKDLHALSVPVPQLKEQQLIVAVINASETNIHISQEYIATLKRIKTGLMQDLLTGRVSVLPLLHKSILL